MTENTKTDTEVLWRFKIEEFTIPQELKKNKRTWTQASWIQVRGRLLGYDIGSTDKRRRQQYFD